MTKLIGLTFFDMRTYINEATKLIGCSPMRVLDEKGIKSDTPESFVLSLEQFSPDNNYQHMNVVFLCELEPITLEFFLMRTSSINLTKLSEGVFVLSINLQTLINVLIHHSKRLTHKNIRKMLSEILVALERVGFKEILSSYRKIALDDGTYVLESK